MAVKKNQDNKKELQKLQDKIKELQVELTKKEQEINKLLNIIPKCEICDNLLIYMKEYKLFYCSFCKHYI